MSAATGSPAPVPVVSCSLDQEHPWSARNASGAYKTEAQTGTPDAVFEAELARPIVSEEDCLSLANEYFPNQSAHLPLGRGSDCAELLRLSHSLALSTDLFLEGRHFKTAWSTPAEVGAKALSSAVSDLAAAGAVPKGFSLGLMLPPGFSRGVLRQIFAAMAEKAAAYKMILSGGDISASPVLGFSLTVWGGPPGPEAEFLRRGKPKPGDCIFLIGEVGLAKAGLRILEQEGRAGLAAWPSAGAAFLNPRPLLAEGQALALLARGQGEGRRRIQLMDVSDGLARDLPRLLGGLGADLTFASELIHPEVAAAADQWALPPEELFLLGGEDYALLGICEESLWPQVWEAVPDAALIGEVAREPGLTRLGKPLAFHPEAGFDHFSMPGEAGVETESKTVVAAPAQGVAIKKTVQDPARSPVSGAGKEDRALPGPARQAAREITAVCKLAWQFGLLAGFNGNASCRIRGLTLSSGEMVEEACLVTRSGAAKNLLTEEDFALLCVKTGTLLAGSAPSSESSMHLAVYRECPDSMAILHTHPPFLLGLSISLPPESRLDMPLPEAEAYRSRLAFTPALPPGSQELADTVARAASSHAAVWMEHHGLMVRGQTLSAALSLAEELEQLARIQLFSMNRAKK